VKSVDETGFWISAGKVSAAAKALADKQDRPTFPFRVLPL